MLVTNELFSVRGFALKVFKMKSLEQSVKGYSLQESGILLLTFTGKTW